MRQERSAKNEDKLTKNPFAEEDLDLQTPTQGSYPPVLIVDDAEINIMMINALLKGVLGTQADYALSG